MSGWTVGVDVGKTGSRVVVTRDGVPGPVVTGRGVVPTPDHGGVRRAAAVVAASVEHAVGEAGEAQHGPCVVGVGMAGVTTLRGGAAALADALARSWPGTQVAVTTDSVTAHVGGLGGDPGVVLAAGTGSVALGLGADDVLRQADGWGQWLGDEGSGAWIGREALRAVVRAADGRGGPTTLSRAAERRFTHAAALPSVLAFGDDLPTRTASFVPDVAAAAAAGDEIAQGILARATEALTEATLAAARAVDAQEAAFIGGLADIEALYGPWSAQVAPHVAVVEARGSSLHGASLIARRTDLPHEAQVVRRTYETPPDAPGEDLDVLETEGLRSDLDDLDMRGTDEIVDVLVGAEAGLPAVLAGAHDGLVAAVGLAEAALRDGGRIVYVGAGTPGRLAALDAAECPPTFGVRPEQVVAVLAGGTDASGRAVEGAEDRTEEATRAMADHDVGPADVVVGVSASGRTPFVIEAMRAARQRGAATVGVVNNPDSVIGANADVAVELLTGAEVVGGSTRLTAGTAQKVTLNTLSTATMIRLGKTYGPRMVDVVASNHKLRRRASRIVREVCAVDDATATEALEAAGWHTKTAIVSLLAGVGVDEARARLTASDGRVRTAVEERR